MRWAFFDELLVVVRKRVAFTNTIMRQESQGILKIACTDSQDRVKRGRAF
jgi:hypothetical protein